MVKPKSGVLQIFTVLRRRFLACVLPIVSLLTFIASWAGLYPSSFVERLYGRWIFPKLSSAAGRLADSISMSWLDFLVPGGILLLVVILWKRQWVLLANVVAGLYLIFFWTWGLNYHRQPLATKVEVDSARTEDEAMMAFAERALQEINRLYGEKQNSDFDDGRVRAEAVRRVRRVVAIIDGSEWDSAQRIKISRVSNPWMHAAGIDGVFNPFPHEPVISDSILDVEAPFVIAHELAHVRGYPDEGDANLIATLATIMSDDPAFRYSGWLNLWLYLRNRDLEKRLDPGPRQDLQRIFDRARREQIEWVNNFQRSLLDIFLKANSIEEGVRSYSRVVLLAAGTEPSWERFR